MKRVPKLDYSIHRWLYFIPSQHADTIGIGFEEEVIIVPESVGTVSVCVVTNLTLDERRTATAVLRTETVSAEGKCCLLVSYTLLMFMY